MVIRIETPLVLNSEADRKKPIQNEVVIIEKIPIKNKMSKPIDISGPVRQRTNSSTNVVSKRQNSSKNTKGGRIPSRSSKSLDQVIVPGGKKTPVVTSDRLTICTNEIDFDPNDYSNIYVSTYRNRFGESYCFHSREYEDLIESKKNPNGEDLKPAFVEEIKKKRDLITSIGASYKNPETITSAITTLNDSDEGFINADLNLKYNIYPSFFEGDRGARVKEQILSVMRSNKVPFPEKSVESNTFFLNNVLWTLFWLENKYVETRQNKYQSLKNRISQILNVKTGGGIDVTGILRNSGGEFAARDSGVVAGIGGVRFGDVSFGNEDLPEENEEKKIIKI